MCDPLSIGIATATVGAASSIMGFEGANQASHANANAANLQASNTYNALGEQESQIDAQQSENSVSALIARTQAQGRISASASSFGTGGATTAELSNATDNEAGRSLAIENLNSQSQRLQVQNQMQGAEITRRNKIASVPAGNPLSLVLGIAKAGLQGSSFYASTQGRFGAAGGKDAGSIADSKDI